MTCIHGCKLEYKIEAYDWVKTILTINPNKFDMNYGVCNVAINIRIYK